MIEFYLSRDELYARMWSKPIRENAKDLGLSDVGLAKLCRRSDIPLPPQGYWLMVPGPERDSLRAPLPTNRSAGDQRFRFRVEEAAVAQRIDEARADILNRIAGASPAEADRVLAAKFAKAMRKAIDVRKRDERGILQVQGKAPVAVRVSPAQLDRALSTQERLMARLSALKVPLTQHAEHAGLVTAEIRGRKYSYWIEETASRSERTLSAREQKERAQSEKAGHYWYYRDRWQFTPTGKLSLKLSGDRYYYPRKQWGDTVAAGIEDRIDQVIADSFALAAEESARDDEWRRRARHDKAVRLLALRRERRQQYEATKVRELKRQARDWARAQQLRGYVDAVCGARLAAVPGFNDEGERAQWIVWARQIIDGIDPLSSGRAGLLPPRPRWGRGDRDASERRATPC